MEIINTSGNQRVFRNTGWNSMIENKIGTEVQKPISAPAGEVQWNIIANSCLTLSTDRSVLNVTIVVYTLR